MKRGLALLVMGTLAACANQEEHSHPVELIGSWQLIEQLADPGNGSGVFVEVESDKTIQFFSDGTVTSNGSLCSMDLSADQPSSGTYDVGDGSITPSDCLPTYKIPFVIEDTHLILFHPICIEACESKYVKI